LLVPVQVQPGRFLVGGLGEIETYFQTCEDMETEVGESNYRRILERLPEAVVLLDRQGVIRYVNPTATRIVKKTSLEIGRSIWEVAPAPLVRGLRAVFDRLLRGEEALVLHSFFAQRRWYEFVAYPIEQEIALLGRDITQHLEAESLRRQSEERFRILLEGVKDYAILMLDPEGRISSWNAGGERLFGYRADEVLGKSPCLLYPPEAAQRPRDNLEAAVTEGHYEDEGWRVRKDGSRLFVNASYSLLYDELGQPSGFAVVTHDVTEQRRTQQSLRTSEERLRLALESAEIGAWDYLIERDQLFMDARSLALAGLPPRSAPYAREDFLPRVHPADRDGVRRAQDRAIAGGSYHVEFRVIDGGRRAERWLEGHGKALRDATGKPFRVLGVVHDVTDRHRYDELCHILPAVVAHDLRSPLSTVKLASQALLKGVTLPESRTRYAETLFRSIDQMAQMANELLDFGQARFGGGLPVNRTRTDLADIASEAVHAARIRCPDCRIELDAQGTFQGFWDRTRMLEVIGNLLGNATKHGSHAQAIELILRDQGDQVSVAVHNYGAPIPAELLPFLFDPFRRAESPSGLQSSEKSYGLGLYIIREIVVAHGGTIEVQSSSETGTTFTVHLPREAAAVAAPELSPGETAPIP
jgi:PAS domain S-box-containing protein